MTVYAVVESYQWEGDRLCGLFSTREKAQAYADAESRPAGFDPKFLVEEYELDAEEIAPQGRIPA